MTALRKDAMDLLERMPEDKLYFIIQIMEGVTGLYGSESEKVREQAFEQLENLRRKAPQIDYERELASYREEKYGTANFGWYKCSSWLSALPQSLWSGRRADRRCL